MMRRNRPGTCGWEEVPSPALSIDVLDADLRNINGRNGNYTEHSKLLLSQWNMKWKLSFSQTQNNPHCSQCNEWIYNWEYDETSNDKADTTILCRMYIYVCCTISCTLHHRHSHCLSGRGMGGKTHCLIQLLIWTEQTMANALQMNGCIDWWVVILEWVCCRLLYNWQRNVLQIVLEILRGDTSRNRCTP